MTGVQTCALPIYPDDNVAFYWSAPENPLFVCPDCQNIEATPYFDGYFTVFMTNSVGCTIKDSVYIRVRKDRTIYYPNIISANGDDINDVFNLFGNAEGAEGQFLKIYDRWGNMVFYSGKFTLNEKNQGWNGTFKGLPVVNGVYTWLSELIFIDGYKIFLKGDITVVK